MRGSEYLLLGANGASVYRSNDGRFPEVLYGVYSVEVSAPAFRGRRLGLAVNQSLNHVRITPENILDPCGVVERSLAGQVLRDSVDGELWVKAVSARGDYSREFALGPLGYFQFSAFPEGSMVLLVMKGDEVLATVTVRDFKQSVTIPLPQAAKR